MANVFIDLPVPAGNGSGASQSTTAMGANKTVTVQGAFHGSITIEISNDGGLTFGSLITFSTPGVITVVACAGEMRVTRSGVPSINPGLPNVDVGANDDGTQIATLNVPVGNGDGVPTVVSGFGQVYSIACIGAFNGAANIQITEDGTSWSTVYTFSGTQGIVSLVFTASSIRVSRSGTTGGLPSISIAAANSPSGGGSGGSGAGGTFVFQPGGGGTGPGVFEDWADLMTALNDARTVAGGTQPTGQYLIEFDNSIVTPCVIPAGTYDMMGVTWVSRLQFSGVTNVTVSDDVSFTSFRNVDGLLDIEYVGDGPPPVADLANFNVFILSKGSINSSATTPFFQTSLAAAEATVIVLEKGASLGGNGNVVVDNPTAGTGLVFSTFPDGNIEANAVSAAAGSQVIFQNFGTSAFVNGTQPGILGAQSFQTEANARLRPVPAGGSPHLAAFGDEVFVPSAPFTVDLPPLVDPTTNGRIIVIKLNSSDPDVVTITPNGTDTIESAASFTFSNATGFGSVVLSPSGTDWSIIAAYKVP